ncbi:hypothetical protein AGMMS50233_05390 [Endomicrobiia bacterium]|nr:hypothetical protein AGMMS50233_05390 [Endomicrobiia bacterium]
MYRDRNMKYLSDDVISESVIKIRNAYPMKKIEVLFVEDSVAELGVPYDSTKSRETSMIYKKLFIVYKGSWLSGVMRYRIDFATTTQMAQGEQGNLPLIPSLENLLGCVGLNKKIFMR